MMSLAEPGGRMNRIIWTCGLLSAVILFVGGCSTASTKVADGTPQTSFPKLDDPICGAITLKIMDSIHIPHKPDEIPFNVWHQWYCVRSISKYGRATFVLLWEPSTYKLNFVIDRDGKVIKATTDPATYQEVIGGFAMFGQFDSISKEVQQALEKYGHQSFSVDVKLNRT